MDKDKMISYNIGLNKDSYLLSFPRGHYSFQLNGVNETITGDLSAISTEVGNILHSSLTTGYYPIGAINMGDSWAIFSKSDTGSEIGIIDIETGTYTKVINADCLNFTRMIKGEYRIVNGCERIIYWVDGVNPDRFMNIDVVLDNPTGHPYLTDGVFNCELIRLKSSYQVACINNVNVNNTGGVLDIGAYQIFLRYEDENGNTTEAFHETPQIPIANDNYNGDYASVTGGSSDDGYGVTSKSITINVDSIDINYAYLQVIVRYTKNGSSINRRIARLPITTDTTTYTISSLEGSESLDLTEGELLILTNPYDVSEAITQHDNRLIRGNVKANFRDYSKFQILMNNAYTNYFWDRIPARDSRDESGSPSTSTYYMDFRSYMRDEVYSLGVVVVFKDGTTSPVFHIPGRRANTKANGDSAGIPQVFDVNTDHPRPDFNTGAFGTNSQFDTALIVATDSTGQNPLPEFKHLNYPEDFSFPGGAFDLKGYVERWKAFNTAFKYGPVRRSSGDTDCDKSAIPGSGDQWGYTYQPQDECGRGDCAFWESEQRYPVIQNCEGIYIYPVEVVDGIVVGQKVRHHKMPDTSLERHFSVDGDNEYIHPLGLCVNNIQFPTEYADDIQGYYIVREKRDNVNKSVLDKGIFYINAFFKLGLNGQEPQEYAIQTNAYNRHAWRRGMTSANFGITTVVEEGLVPIYSTIDIDAGSMEFRSIPDNSSSSNLANVEKFLAYDDESQSFHAPMNKFTSTTYNGSHIKIEGKYRGDIEPFEEDFQCSPKNAEDATLTWRYSAVEYDEFEKYDIINRTIDSVANLTPDSELPQGILKRDFININQQETLVVELFENEGLDNDTDAFNGTQAEDGVYSRQASALYGSVKRYNKAMYGQLGVGNYFRASKCMHLPTETDVQIYGGDVFINKFSFFKSSMSKFTTESRAFLGSAPGSCQYLGPGGSDSSSPFSLNKTLISYYVESEVNTDLRHIDQNNLGQFDNTYWELFNGSKLDFLKLDWNGDAGDVSPDSCPAEGAFAPWFCDEYARNLYLYNFDYSKERDIKVFNPIQDSFNYCSECIEEFPHRIIYSERAFQEERQDNYRVTLANNFGDIPPGTGEITNLFVNFDKLYCHTERTPYQIFTKAQTMQADQSTLYIGTGEFFSIPSQELVTTKYGYAGSTDRFGTVTTEFGTVYVDSFTGNIFLQADGLQNIGDKGLRNWMKENVPITFKKQYKEIFGEDYEVEPGLPNGVGFMSTYDPRHKRIIITKHDYNVIGELTNESQIDFSNTDLFEDRSWTLSYSFLSNSWISWHSYKPKFYTIGANTFYSFDPDNSENMYKHNEGNETTYYDTKRSWIVEMPIVDANTFSLNSFHWISETKEYDEARRNYRNINDVTFTRGLVYNDNQSTGLFTITPKTDSFTGINWSNSDKLASPVNRNWYLSGLRNLAINDNEPIVLEQWTDSQYFTEYQAENFIDKVPNQNIIDYNKSLYELDDLRAKVHFVRLFFKPESNYKKVLFAGNARSFFHTG